MAEVVITQYVADADAYLQTLNKMEDANMGVAKAEGKVEKDGKKAFTNVAKEAPKVNKSIDGIGSRLKVLAGGFIAAFSIQKILGGALKTIKGFDSALAELGSITGLTAETGLNDLAEQAVETSLLFGTSAEDILKGFQLVGSAKPELLANADALAEVTLQAEILGKAAGLDLPSAAEALTKSLNQFGAGADEAATFTDILATSQQKGTATIAQLSESFKNVGADASAAGLSFEATNIALQALAKGGILGAEAGTKLRGALGRLQVQGFGFASGQFNVADAIGEVEEKLNAIEDPIERAKFLQDSFGEDTKGAVLTLIAQKDVLTDLEGTLNETGNALNQAKNNTDTLAGSQEILGATYDAFVLKLDSGEGAISGFFTAAISGATQFLNTLIRVEEEGVRGLIASFIETTPTFVAFQDNIQSAVQGALSGNKENLENAKNDIEELLDSTKKAFEDAIAAGDVFAANALLSQIETLSGGLAQLGRAARGGIGERVEAEEEVTDAVNTESEERTKQREKEADDALKLADRIRQAQIDLIADEGAQSIAQIEFNFEKQSRELIDGNEDQLKLLKLLEDQKNEAILEKQDDLFKDRIAAQEDDQKEREEIAKDALDFEQDALEKQFTLNELFIEQTVDNEDEADALRLNNKANFLEEQIELLEEFGEDSTDLQLELAQTQNEIDDSQDKLEQERNEQRLELQKNLLGASLELLSTFGAENAGAAKVAALAEIAVNRAIAISALVKDAQAAGITPIDKAIIFATGLIQIAAGITQARQALEGFKEGVIGYDGTGTGTSDSNVVRISKGESIIRASATDKHREELHAINDGTFNDFVYERYVLPNLNAAIKDKGERESKTFANSIADGLKISAELGDGNLLSALKKRRTDGRTQHEELLRALMYGSYLGKSRRR